MKRQSRAEAALTDQLRRIEDRLANLVATRAELSASIDTVANIRDQLEAEIAAMRTARGAAPNA